jgi:hypothetical protein
MAICAAVGLLLIVTVPSLLHHLWTREGDFRWASA